MVWFEMGLVGNGGAGLSLCSSAFVWETFLQILKCCPGLICTVNMDGASGAAGGGSLVASGEGDISGREGNALLEQRENLGQCCRVGSCGASFSPPHPLLGCQGEQSHVPAHGLAFRELRCPSNSGAAARSAGAVLGAGHGGVHPRAAAGSVHPQSLWQHQNSPDGILSLQLQDPHISQLQSWIQAEICAWMEQAQGFRDLLGFDGAPVPRKLWEPSAEHICKGIAPQLCSWEGFTGCAGTG